MSLAGKIEKLAGSFDGRCGVAAVNLQTGEEILYHAEEIFPTASAIKLAVLATLFEKAENHQTEGGVPTHSLNETLTLRRADKVGGSGILQHMTPGLAMPVRDWAFLMMNLSDNSATNVLIDYVGLEGVANWLAAAGFDKIHLHRKIDFGPLPEEKRYFGTATPYALNRLMTAIYCGQIISPAACEEMLRLMTSVGADRAGRYLPFEPYGTEVAETEQLHLAGKTGSIQGVRTQTAAVWRGSGEQRRGFTLTVMTDGNNEPETWSVDAPGVLLIGRIARAVYDGLLGG